MTRIPIFIKNISIKLHFDNILHNIIIKIF